MTDPPARRGPSSGTPGGARTALAVAMLVVITLPVVAAMCVLEGFGAGTRNWGYVAIGTVVATANGVLCSAALRRGLRVTPPAAWLVLPPIALGLAAFLLIATTAPSAGY